MLNRSISFFILVFIIQVCNAQFPEVKWEYFIGAPAFGSAAAADLDSDGYYEIVFTTYTNDGRAHCLNAEDGSVKWIYDIGGCGDVAPIIYDMNSDGIQDVVINGSCNPTIFCIDGVSGNLIWSKPSGGGDSPPTIADMDNDGRPEVLFGNFNGQIIVLNGEDGSTAKTIQANPFGNALQTEPTLVDIDQNGTLEIIAANFWNNDGLHIWAFDYESTNLLWTNSVIDTSSDFHAYHGGAVADLDADGKMEYVIGSNNGDLRAINVEDGSDLWTIAIPGSLMSAVSIADLDTDGTLEVIFNNNDPVTFDDRIWVVSGEDGSEEWSFPITFSSFRGFSISDFNNNGKLDLVSGHFMGKVRAVEPGTGLIWEIDLKDFFNESTPWFEADHQPLIADFDKNGTLDIFVVGGYGTYQPDALNTGKAFMIEAGEGTCPEWLMFRQDIKRSGYFSNEEIEESCMVTSIDEQIFIADWSISPNPSNGSITIDFTLLEKSKVEIIMYDVLGRIVQVLENEIIPSGDHQVNWATELSGIYFCEMRIGDQHQSKKIVIGH